MKNVPVWVWIVVGLFVLGGIASLTGDESGDKPEPAPKVSKPTPEPVDVSAEDLVDAGFVDEQQFCRAYANALSAGLGEDFAYGNFLRGYQRADIPAEGPAAREVFDELVGRC